MFCFWVTDDHLCAGSDLILQTSLLWLVCQAMAGCCPACLNKNKKHKSVSLSCSFFYGSPLCRAIGPPFTPCSSGGVLPYTWRRRQDTDLHVKSQYVPVDDATSKAISPLKLRHKVTPISSPKKIPYNFCSSVHY